MRLQNFGGIPFWRDVRVLRAAVQVASAVVVIGLVYFFISNVLNAADERGLSLGFDFLDQEAGFPISDSVLPYDESKSFLYAFLAGVANTLKVALLGIVLATTLGIVIGVSRLSPNWLVRTISSVYIEIFRNVPLLVQLFFWLFGVLLLLPLVHDSIEWPGPIFFSNRGIFSVWGRPSAYFSPWLMTIGGGLALAIVTRLAMGRLQLRLRRPTYPNLAALLIFLIVGIVGWFSMPASPIVKEVPVLGRLNFEGGLRLTPEFLALMIGLVLYTATFIAEIVRSGIQSVQRGQVEAAEALGLKELEVLRFVVFPQALRVIIPPLISQHLNLAKNSSLALAIGYPDLFGISRIMINQAGRAVPIFLMLMGAYLAISLTLAIIGNIYNRYAQIGER